MSDERAKLRLVGAVVGTIALVVGMAAVAWFWEISPDDLSQMAAPPDFKTHVGEEVTLEGRYRGFAQRHPGEPIAGKMAQRVVLSNRRRMVVHSEQALSCTGVLVLTGTVVQVTHPRGPQFQLDVSSSRCRHAQE